MPPPLFLAADDEDKEEEDEDKEEDGGVGLAPVLLCVGWDGGNVREGRREGHHQEQGMG